MNTRTDQVIFMARGEIRERLGISREEATRVVNRTDFPRPYGRIAMGRIWLATDVEAWFREQQSMARSNEDRPNGDSNKCAV